MSPMYSCANCGKMSYGQCCSDECKKEYEKFIQETLRRMVNVQQTCAIGGILK